MSEQIISENGNQLVIYYEKQPLKDGPRVQIDEFTLISQEQALKVLEAGKTVVEIGEKLGDMYQKGNQTPEPPSLAKTTITSIITINFADVGTVHKTDLNVVKHDGNPFKWTTVDTIEGDKGTITRETTSWRLPFIEFPDETHSNFVPKPSQPVTVEKTPGTSPNAAAVPNANAAAPNVNAAAPNVNAAAAVNPNAAGANAAVPAADVPADAGKNHKVIVPQDEGWVGAELTDSFLNIMNNFGTMEFSTSKGAQTYLDDQLKKAGIEIKITSTGMELADAGTRDPAGVASQLRKQGIQDEELIAQVRAEANDVIKRFEDSIVMLQAVLSERFPPSDSPGDPGDPADPGDLNDPYDPADFSALITQWNEEFASKFSTDVPDPIKKKQPNLDITNGVVTMTAPYASTHEYKRVSPTGLIIRAGVGIAVDKTPVSDVAPGFHASPLISVFDEDAWKMEA